jgi:hypothetical protein
MRWIKNAHPAVPLAGIVLCVAWAIAASGPASVQEPFKATNPDEFQQALQQAGPGDTIHVSGKWNKPMSLGKMKYLEGAPLKIIGPCTVPNISIMDCHYVEIDGLTVVGGYPGQMAGINLNDSYPEIGLKGIKLKNGVILPPAGPRGIFLGGHNVQDIKIVKYIIVGPIGGTHGIYFSGGAFNENWPAIQDVVIRGCTIELQPGARNGIQFNGKYLRGIIANNLIRHAHLNGITLIGCQDYEVTNNVVYGCERGTGAVVYDYAHSWAAYYNYFETQADIDLFNARHWPNQRIHIHHNTFVVGPKAFCNWPGNNEDPTKNHPAILINNGIHSGFTFWKPGPLLDGGGQHVPHPGWSFPTEDIWIQKNILYSPNLKMIAIYHEHEAAATSITSNIFWSTKEGEPYIDHVDKLKTIAGSLNIHPGFSEPIYDYVDMELTPNYDWTTFQTQFDAFSLPGFRRGIGKKFPMPVLGQGHRVDPHMIRMMEHADPELVR